MTNSDDQGRFVEEDIPVVRLNLGIVIPALEKHGGAERYLIECVKFWQHRHDITIYATTFNRNLLSESGITEAVNLIELEPHFEGEHSFLMNAVLLPKLWRQQIGRHDVYHTHLWPSHLVDLHPMVWFPHEPLRVLHDLRFEQRLQQTGQASREVHVYPKYNYDLIGGGLYDAYRSAIDGMDRTVTPEFTVANSGYTAGYLARIYGRDMPHTIYPGVDAENFIDLKVDQKLFVTISQLWPHKRVNLLIEAIALTDEIQLIVIGSGLELDHLQSLCVKLGVDDRVFFLSGLSNYEVRLVLARSCAFLFCPIREPFGIVVLEAMAAGKPIVAVDEGGYVEICHPDFAMLIPPSPLIFAEKMQYLRDNPQQARMMGEAARKAVTPFSWKRTANELESILLRAGIEAKSAHKLQPTQDRSRPLVGIQYYLWYGEGFGAQHWNDNPRLGHVGDHPFLGFYPSEKGQTIEYHLSQFEAMRLDFAILNLHIDNNGPNETELRSIENLFEISAARNSSLRFAIQISPFNDDADHIRSTLSRIRTLYADREEYFRIDGKPALFWFWSSAYDGNWALFEVMREAAADFRNFALSLRLAKGIDERRYTFGFFEAFGLYSPLESSSEENWDRVWQSAYDASGTAGMTYRIATVSPGYDDHALMDPSREGNPYRIVPRRSGEIYARSLKFAESLSTPPDLVIVSTYNEYHENTHIEPSSRNGDMYVRMTRDFVERISTTILHRAADNG
jgi:glycosyltransferase involved in cell wall biosynthesis